MSLVVANDDELPVVQYYATLLFAWFFRFVFSYVYTVSSCTSIFLLLTFSPTLADFAGNLVDCCYMLSRI